MKIGLLVGSLRKDSFNKKIALNVQEMVKGPDQAEIIDLANLPFYNEDLDQEGQVNEDYARIRRMAHGADGFIFITPEYNRSLAPVLKNFIDVASRDHEVSPLAGKPAAVFSSTPGGLGGMASNHALRQAFVFTQLQPMQSEVYLSEIHECFEGDRLNKKTYAFVNEAVQAFLEFAKKVNAEK